MKPPTLILASSLLFALVACGGGGSTGGTTPPSGPTTITVAGKVFKWTGKPLQGVPVFISDTAGSKPQVLTGTDGSFSVAGVQTPYMISAVPAADGTILPISYDKVTIANPQLVVANAGFTPNFQADCDPLPADAALPVSFPAIGAGNTAKVYFLAKGIDYRPTESRVVSNDVPAGSSSTTLTVSFDKNLCQDKLSGKLVYLERDAAGTIVKKGSKDVSVLPGNPPGAPATAISTGTAAGGSLKGSVQLPQGLAAANVSVYMKIGTGPDSVYARLGDPSGITGTIPNFDLAIPDLSADGISFRIVAIGNVQWAWSDAQTGPASGIAIALPGNSAPVTPNGDTPGGNVTPTFSYNLVSGVNFYYTFMVNPNDFWLGGTPQTSIKLPVLSAPARIAINTAYDWAPITAINLRDASATNGSDKLLDGRAIKHSYIGSSALGEPDLVAAGVLASTSTPFKILP
jgi:hypothetical protein